jgi:hypothetical protein
MAVLISFHFGFSFTLLLISGHLIPCSALKDSSRSLLLYSAPLLEEKWDLGPQALISNICDPFLEDRPCAGTRFATHDHPIDIFEILRS